MPKFGTLHFNEYYFGNYDPMPHNYKLSIKRQPLGITIRKQLGKRVIFRVRRGNGYYGSSLTSIYQDKYKYTVPSSINNIQGQPARNAFAQAVSNWQNLLTDTQKKEYNIKATKGYKMSGYNLYIRDYMRANV